MGLMLLYVLLIFSLDILLFVSLESNLDLALYKPLKPSPSNYYEILWFSISVILFSEIKFFLK